MRLRPTPFVLLAKSRSGSKWLVELLDGHDEIAAYGEMLGGDQVPADYGATGFPRYTSWLGTRRRLPGPLARVSYLNRLFATRPDVKAVGVKLVYGHLGPDVLAYFSARRVRIVHLVRHNVFDAMLSYEVAKARGLYATRIGDSVPPVTVTLDPATLRSRLEEHEFSIVHARAAILRYRLPWTDVSYEELVARRDETLQSVCRFLHVSPRVEGLQSSFAPVDDVPRSDVVENFDEVCEALVGTRFEWMLREPAPAQSAHAVS
jgi:LPS sulfotransferase NodH